MVDINAVAERSREKLILQSGRKSYIVFDGDGNFLAHVAGDVNADLVKLLRDFYDAYNFPDRKLYNEAISSTIGHELLRPLVKNYQDRLFASISLLESDGIYANTIDEAFVTWLVVKCGFVRQEANLFYM